jgi:hypothetical protein
MEHELLSAPPFVAVSRSTPPLHVTVVGDNARTIESLREYLTAAGVDFQSMRRLPENTADLALGDAVVIFPDEFETQTVLETVEAMQREHPKLQLLLVTSLPQRYQAQAVIDGAQPPMLLPKPAFGWAILDAIRASSSSTGESS